jgi:hypothetical protein
MIIKWHIDTKELKDPSRFSFIIIIICSDFLDLLLLIKQVIKKG